jgi:short-subunit dehydrogenase
MAETALVTGASSGIGEQFARQLSDRGYRLVLVARRTDRLEQIAAELPTQADVVGCDLSREAADLPARVEALDGAIDLLVNNAGFGHRGRFLESDAARNAEMVRVNCEAVVVLTRAFLPAMIESGRGGVITVASTAGMQPLPYESVYAATKAFALNFTDALHTELRGSGVRILAVNPGPVPTEWRDVAGYDESTNVMPGEISAEQVVREALAAYDKGRRSMIPGRAFRWFMRGSSVGPRAVQLRVAERIYRPSS